MWPADDTGVVDHRVHRPEPVHLPGDASCLLQVGQVPDDRFRAAVQQVAHGGEAIGVAGVDDDLVSVLEQRLRSRPPEAVGGAGDEDTCHETSWRRSGAGRWRGRVLLVGDVLSPADGAAALVVLLHGDVNHEAVRSGPVPVVLAGLEEHAVAGPDHLDRSALSLA